MPSTPSIESVSPMIPPSQSLARVSLILLVSAISCGSMSSRCLAQQTGPDPPSRDSPGLESKDSPQTVSVQGSTLFESKIRPVLVEHCYECHSLSAGVVEGGLRLDTRQATLRGGDRGAAVVAGKPQESWLWKALSHEDPDLRMPPKSERLPDSVIADFRRWIQHGASDPRDETAFHSARSKANTWWSFQPPTQPSLPPEDPWCRDNRGPIHPANTA